MLILCPGSSNPYSCSTSPNILSLVVYGICYIYILFLEFVSGVLTNFICSIVVPYHSKQAFWLFLNLYVETERIPFVFSFWLSHTKSWLPSMMSVFPPCYGTRFSSVVVNSCPLGHCVAMLWGHGMFCLPLLGHCVCLPSCLGCVYSRICSENALSSSLKVLFLDSVLKLLGAGWSSQAHFVYSVAFRI